MANGRLHYSSNGSERGAELVADRQQIDADVQRCLGAEVAVCLMGATEALGRLKSVSRKDVEEDKTLTNGPNSHAGTYDTLQRSGGSH